MNRRLGTLALSIAVACNSPQATERPPGEQVTTTSTATKSAEQTTTTALDQATTTIAVPAETTTTQPEISIHSDHDGLTCWVSPPQQGRKGLSFSDVTAGSGLLEPLTGMHGHAVIWADINGDHLQDLYVGTFADRDIDRYAHRGAAGPSPDRLLVQTRDGSFIPNPGLPDMFPRTSGGAAADLDLDGDLDLVISRNYRNRPRGETQTQVVRNDGETFVPLTGTGIPEKIGGRSVAIFDYDHDGLQDVFVTEDRWSGGSSILLANRGGLQFEDVTSEAGIPTDVHGLGVAVADLTNDGLLDVFVAGSNRLFVANGEGFKEADSRVFQWETFGDEDDVAGVSVADLNRDGWLDLAVGHHYNSTLDFDSRVPIRIYLNRGPDSDGSPRFEDVTSEAGLPGLATKAPHVELADLDNDGWPDLVTSASAGNGTMPAIFRHEGLDGDIPVFSSPPGLGAAQYWVASPTADFDNDGRLDIFLLEWEPALPSLLMRNETSSGNWIEVSVGPEHGFGLGWRVDVFRDQTLIGAREITVTQGYSAGVSPVAHLGVGDAETVTVELSPPGTGGRIVLNDVAVNQHLRYPSGCGS